MGNVATRQSGYAARMSIKKAVKRDSRKRRPTCLESANGRHRRGTGYPGAEWWCSWCSAEIGLPRIRRSSTKAKAK